MNRVTIEIGTPEVFSHFHPGPAILVRCTECGHKFFNASMQMPASGILESQDVRCHVCPKKCEPEE